MDELLKQAFVHAPGLAAVIVIVAIFTRFAKMAVEKFSETLTHVGDDCHKVQREGHEVIRAARDAIEANSRALGENSEAMRETRHALTRVLREAERSAERRPTGPETG